MQPHVIDSNLNGLKVLGILLNLLIKVYIHTLALLILWFFWWNFEFLTLAFSLLWIYSKGACALKSFFFSGCQWSISCNFRWFAKRFLHPDIISTYDYIFLWDEDPGVEHFHPGRYSCCSDALFCLFNSLTFFSQERICFVYFILHPQRKKRKTASVHLLCSHCRMIIYPVS